MADWKYTAGGQKYKHITQINMFCPEQKAASDDYRKNYDHIKWDNHEDNRSDTGK